METYSYNSFGYLISNKIDQLGDEIAVNREQTYERDIKGRATIERVYQADGTLVVKGVQEFDIYDRSVKLTHYSNEQNISSIIEKTFDAFDRLHTQFEDNNGNGIYDVGDIKFSLTYSDDARNLVIRRLNTRKNSVDTETTTDVNYLYNEKGLRTYEFVDLNNNQTADDNEVVTHVNYVGDTNFVDRFEYGYGLDREKIFADWKFVFPDAGSSGTHIAGIRTDVAPDQSYIQYGVHGLHYTTKDDYTNGNWSALLDNYQGKITHINLTNTTAYTEVTIDNDVIAKISKNPTLLINGDSTDTVRLKDNAEFTKLDTTVKRGSNDYAQYTTEVDGQQYTLLIDTDINVVLA